ncbi:beta-adaptin-like protein b [Anaeramoeba flamelloides]|uniref:AP complex subunit beta n=1 Tax=Anaeramoeba flamelloides TaxID=1746091 RepID=A0AAV7YI45_9EUKA|nr:beta-adaptin-like protein b [Anaeramoeba flamelloides]
MTQSRDELHELRLKLSGENASHQKEAVKQVVAYMTVGKDVSSLFTEVLKCMTTEDLEMKKLVYLYLMTYAKFKPDLSILVVNSFIQDAKDENPLVRALAIRTMGSIRVEEVTEYLCQPLRRCLKDSDPYVKKTAALCVAKLFEMDPELIESQGFIEDLLELITDSNSMVVSNALAALQEINSVASKPVFVIDKKNLSKILNAMGEANEWSQVFILDTLSTYTPRNEREAESLIERIIPRMSHKNAAVVLSSVRAILQFMINIENKKVLETYYKKMAPSLVSLLTNPPEVQYVALKNINLIVQKYPTILKGSHKVFFCRYNDPTYVKMEKLEILIMLANENNVEALLKEFKVYAQEVDVSFVRKAVRAIGLAAIKIPSATQRCIKHLLSLIKSQIHYVTQEVVVVVKDIFRKYPNKYESIIGTLCNSLTTLDDIESKSSMIWIIGQYADRIENSDELLESFLESFDEENPEVQLQLLTSTVKLFLHKPEDSQELLQDVLSTATQESENPDLRERAYIYWRMLSTDPDVAKEIILGEKPLIEGTNRKYHIDLLETLLFNIPSLSSVFHKPPENFVTNIKVFLREDEEIENDEEGILQVEEEREKEEEKKQEETTSTNQTIGSLIDFNSESKQQQNQNIQQQKTTHVVQSQDIRQNKNNNQDEYGMGLSQMNVDIPKKLILDAEKGEGLEIKGIFQRRENSIFYELSLTNKTQAPIGGFACVFNTNSFGLKPNGWLLDGVLMPMQTRFSSIPCPIETSHIKHQNDQISNLIQIAIGKDSKVYYCQDEVPFTVFCTEDGKLGRSEFLKSWKNIPDEVESLKEITDLTESNSNIIKLKLENKNIFFVAKRKADELEIMYFSLKTPMTDYILLELAIDTNSNTIQLATRTNNTDFVGMVELEIEKILKEY